jgi:hypothetical protein
LDITTINNTSPRTVNEIGNHSLLNFILKKSYFHTSLSLLFYFSFLLSAQTGK